ncbi:TonB-dependent receptor plug domain-containing protein [Maricaulis parjimensis]|uniref:TonB-dependent receptor plug domain-containing protein n=1 Tax=Maricaulis parjimensis TaxID=144023 RepID=UPI001939983F|nr:TonB-dependent receptor [Maricaulis parjimensis]
MSKSVWLTPVLALPSILLPVPALAQDAASDDVVLVTAARVGIVQSDATSSITRLGEAELDARDLPFLADTLRSVPGLAISRSGPAGSLTQIRARGSEANHVLVLIDGVEANNPFTGEADFAHFAFDDLGSVEVARGEQSALWGADAIGGVIRLTTARPETGLESSARIEAGDFGTRQVSARIASTRETGWFSLSGSQYASNGIDVSGLGGETDGYENASVNLAGARDLGEGVRLEGSLRWLGYDSQYDSDTDYDGRLNDVDRLSRGRTVFARTALSAGHGVGSLALEHELAIQLTDDRTETFADAISAGEALGQRLQAHYQITGRWQTGSFGHRLTGLVEQEQDRLKAFAGPGAGSNQSRQIETRAIALDYGLDLGAFDVTASLRQDQHELFENATTWRVGAGWDIAALNGRVRVNWGDGVKNPGIYELFGYFPAYFQGNPALQPERSRGWEIGWDQSLLDGKAFWSIVWFQSDLEDEIYTDFSAFPSTALNAVTASDRSGLEVSASWGIAPDWSAFGSLTWLESEEAGVTELRRPEQLASLTLDWHPRDGAWSGAVSIDHTGEQVDTDFATYLPVTLDAYTLVSGQLRYAVDPRLDIYVRGENLLDEEYQDVVGYHTPGRGLYLGLRLRNR